MRQNGENSKKKTPPFLNGHEIIIIYRDIKKKKRERERGKEGELVEYSI